MKHFKKIFFLSVLFLMFSCSNGLPPRNEVIVHEPSDPETMNPINYTDATSGYITNHIFQKLVDSDFRNPDQYVGVLAESRPGVEKISDSAMQLTFRIRKEAKWDNGTPVTAKDVEFTLKIIKCPLVNNPNAKPYFEYISDFRFDDDDPLKFTVISNRLYFLAEATFGDIPILPEYIYDPKGLLKKFTLKEISTEKEKLNNDAAMREFAEDFNSEKRMRDPNFISGSSPYKFSEWKTNERIILTKKENWWGHALEKENCYFESYPDKLIYQIVKDQTTALVSLKAGNIDVMRSVKSKDFSELHKSEKFTQNFNGYTPLMYAYAYIAVNVKRPVLSDKLTRQALAHLVDVDKMIETIKYGMASKVIGPIHPSKKKDYNSDVKPYDYNMEEAKKLLEQAGWKNTNGDETLDKIIDGKRTEFIIDFYVNSESDERKAIALMTQAEAKKAGIKINVVTNDFVVFIGKCRKHEFDLMTGVWVGGPAPDDFKQTFHTDATVSGSNFSNFSNQDVDALIESIRSELNEDKRSAMYKRLQQIFHDDVPMIFLWAPTERIAISKRFDNAEPSVIRPGHWEQGFKVK